MARYEKDLVLSKPAEFVEFIVNDYLQKNQFVVADWKGEAAYRTGDAVLEGYKYLKWSYQNGVFHLEAWLKGSFGKEMGLDGFWGFGIKKPYKESLEQLQNALQQDIPDPSAADGLQPILVDTTDNTKAATYAVVFGALSIIFALFIPLLGICLSILGITRAKLGGGSSKAELAKWGRILCIIGLVVAIVVWLMNIVMSVLLI